MNAKLLLLHAARACGLFHLSRRLTAKQPRILAYHGIWLGHGHFGNFLFMSADKFARRMARIEQLGYPVISLEQYCEQSSPLPPCATVITIDDGWYGSYEKMLPVLERHNFPATIYLTSYYCNKQLPIHDVAIQYLVHLVEAAGGPLPEIPAYADQPAGGGHASADELREAVYDITEQLPDEDARQDFVAQLCAHWGLDWAGMRSQRWFHLMSPEEVGEAARRGIVFELHTHRHRTSHQGDDCLAREITDNRNEITRMTGREAHHFCYPSGRYHEDNWPVLQQLGIHSATTTEMGLARSDANPLALPRLLDGEDIADIEFEAEISGFLDLLRRRAGTGG